MYNKVVTIGRLVAKPELIQTSSGKSLTRVTVAVNRRFRSKAGEREVDFINMVAWGRQAQHLVSYASKGSLLSVDGEIRTRNYDKDGKTIYVTEVLIQTFQLLESRAQRAMRENQAGDDLTDLVLEEEPLPF